MTLSQQIITIAMCVLGTMLTRFLPFAVFSSKRPTPPYIQYLGKVLPGAIFSMLVVYCLRHVSLLQGSHGFPPPYKGKQNCSSALTMKKQPN